MCLLNETCSHMRRRQWEQWECNSCNRPSNAPWSNYSIYLARLKTSSIKNAAAIVNASKEWGTLEPGKLANVILVDGKPDQRIADTHNVATVIKEGVVIDRLALRLDHSHIPDYAETGTSMAEVW